MSLSKLIIFITLFLSLINTVNASNSISIENAWSPEAPPVAKVMAGYMKINNHSNQSIKIKSAKSNLFQQVEIHLTKMKNGMMTMVKQENLSIKAKSHIELKSGGLHMMLMGKLEQIAKGSTIPVTLTFDNGEEIEVNLLVKKDDKSKDMHHHHHHH